MGEVKLEAGLIYDSTKVNAGAETYEHKDDGAGLSLSAAYEAPIGGDRFFVGGSGGLQGFILENTRDLNVTDFSPKPLSADDANLLGAPATEAGTNPNNSMDATMNTNRGGIFARAYGGVNITDKLSAALGFGLGLSSTFGKGRAPIIEASDGEIADYDGQSDIKSFGPQLTIDVGAAYDVSNSFSVGARVTPQLTNSTKFRTPGLDANGLDGKSGYSNAFRNTAFMLFGTYTLGAAKTKEAAPIYTLADGQADLDAYRKAWVTENTAALEACHIDPAEIGARVSTRESFDTKTLPLLESIVPNAMESGIHYYITADGSLTGKLEFSDFEDCSNKLKQE